MMSRRLRTGSTFRFLTEDNEENKGCILGSDWAKI